MNLPRPTLVGILAIALSLSCVSPFSTSPGQTSFQGSPTRSTPPCRSQSSQPTSRHRHQQHTPPVQHIMVASGVAAVQASIAGPPSGHTTVLARNRRRLGHVRRHAGADSWVGEAEATPDATTSSGAAPVGNHGAPGAKAPSKTAQTAAADFPPICDVRTFRELFAGRLPDWLLSRLEHLGFASPTLVQRQALEVILDESKSDAVLHAQTGSGKTLAFLLPLFAMVDPSRSAVQGLVVVPTRELGLQVAGVAKRLAAATGSSTGGKVQIMSVLEGSSNKRQRAWAWADPPHIVIGNPENLSKLVTTGAIRVNAVSYVVVDEVDACLLSEGTRAWLHELLARSLSPTHMDEDEEDEEEAAKLLAVGAGRVTGASTPVVRRVKDRQTVFASATVPQHNHFIRQCVQKQWTLTEPVHVQVHAKEAMPPCLSHFYVVCPPEQKLPVLRALIKRELGAAAGTGPSGVETDTRGLVFALPTKPLENIASSMDKALGGSGGEKVKGGPEVVPLANFIREELGLNARADTMSLFREGKTRLLVSTDMAARGLDVPEITHVFNLDLPADGEGYVHRGGRAGRLGRPGKIISIVTPAQEFVIRRLGNGIGVDIKRINLGSKSRKPSE